MQCFQKSILFFKIAPYHIDWFSKKFHSNKVWQQFFVFVLQTSSEVVWILWNGTHDIALSQHLTFDNYSTHNFLFLAVRVFDRPIIPETENELFVTKYIYWSYLQKCRWQLHSVLHKLFKMSYTLRFNNTKCYELNISFDDYTNVSQSSAGNGLSGSWSGCSCSSFNINVSISSFLWSFLLSSP